MNYSLCIGISAFVSAAATISTVAFTYFKNVNDSKVSRERNEKIINLQQQVTQTQALLIAKTEELNNELTGGNSFCLLTIRILRSPKHILRNDLIVWSEMIGVVNMGDYELRDVHVHVEKPKLNLAFMRSTHSYDTQNPELAQDFDIPSLIGKSNNQTHGTLLINKEIPANHIIDNTITYAASIRTRKGLYTQISKQKINNGVWQGATKLINASGETVYEDIDPRYPRKPDGSVDWTMID
jgi:hypothetical protein